MLNPFKPYTHIIHTMNNAYYTQDSLQAKRKIIDKELRLSKGIINHHWQKLTTPTKADTQMQQWVNQAEKAFAVYDGFMMMYKLMRRFGAITSLFKRKSNKKKSK